MKSFFFDSNDFLILHILADGSYGEVFKALHLSSNTFFALKNFRAETLIGEDGLSASFLREMAILRAFPHENVIGCKGLIEKDKSYYAVLELAEKDLRERISEGINTQDQKRIIFELLSALNHLHSNYIIHRDVKPSNILCDERGKVKLADFGLARKVHSSKQILYSRNVVTLRYRAPELLSGEGAYGPGIDLWAVGCVMAELMLQTPLFNAVDDITLLRQICSFLRHYQPDELESIYEKIDCPETTDCNSALWENIFSREKNDLWLDLLLKLLNFDFKKRITAAEALQHSWLNSNL